MSEESLEPLRRRLQELEGENLDLRDEVERLEDQQDVLENFVFGLEQEHEEARALIAETQRELQARHDQLIDLKRQQDELLETMDEGLIAVGADGLIGSQHSRAALAMLGVEKLAGRRFSELLDDAELVQRFDEFIEVALSATHATRRMLAAMNPLDGVELVIGGEPRRISANVVRFESRSGEPKLLFALRDRTDELRLEAELRAQERKQRARIERAYQLLVTPPGHYEQLRRDAVRLLELLRASPVDHDRCHRVAHGLKGDARALGLDALAVSLHAIEEALSPGTSAEVLRRLAEGLEGDIDEDGTVLDRFAELRARSRGGDSDRIGALVTSCAAREADAQGVVVDARVTSDLQAALRDPFLEALRTPLLALVRNAVAHGGEPPEVRVSKGKPEALRVEVHVQQREAEVVVRVRDDGRGIDFDKLAARAVSLGVLDAKTASELSRSELTDLLFVPRLSSRDTADMSAGRGMGMDIVREAVRAASGGVHVESRAGVYTECRLTLPLSTLRAVSGTQREAVSP